MAIDPLGGSKIMKNGGLLSKNHAKRLQTIEKGGSTPLFGGTPPQFDNFWKFSYWNSH